MIFDVTAYLESRSIHYTTKGRNVSTGWIGICCPYCDDISDHLGINLRSGYHTCWKCQSSGSAIKLIMTLDTCSYAEAKNILDDYSTTDYFSQEKEKLFVGEFILPPLTTYRLPKIHQHYLAKRGFNPSVIQKKYNVHACHTVGEYRYRLIIPIYLHHKLVNFVARDVTGNFDRRYLMPARNSVPFPRDMLLYGIDQVKDTAVIVEGVFDAWRIGYGAVATFGTRVTDEQCALLYRKNLKHAYVLFDADACEEEGSDLAKKLSYIIPHVENIRISEGDPDTYFRKHPEDLQELHSMLRQT